MNTPSRFIPLSALLVVCLVTACKDSSGPTPSGGAANLRVHTGNGQGANAGSAVSQPLAVRVTDANDAPVADVAVTFVVRSGGGTLTGGAARTDDQGIATTGTWTLGSNLGANTVEATVTGLPMVTFTATGRCASSGTLALATPLSGILTVSDCRYSGGYLTDRYTFTTSTQQAVRFSQGSQLFDTYLEIYDAVGNILAFNDDSTDVPGAPASMLKILLAPGTYELSPSSFEADETGAYSLSAVAVPESTNTCELVFAMPGTTMIGELVTGDCATTGTPPFLFERIVVFMLAGRSYAVTMNSSALDAYLELFAYNGNGQTVAFNDNSTGTNARVTFTPTVTNFYIISPSSAARGESGAFTLIIE